MTRYLLEVNVLVALIDPSHIQHEEAHAWLARVGCKSFATCPITENGLLRVAGHPKPPNSPGLPSAVASALKTLRELPGHKFWADSISLMNSEVVDTSLLSSHSRVSDSYLLALARANKGQLATLDQKLATEVVADGKSSLALI